MTDPLQTLPINDIDADALPRDRDIRRELTKSGWILRFSGSEAKIPGLMDDVRYEIERMFGPER